MRKFIVFFLIPGFVLQIVGCAPKVKTESNSDAEIFAKADSIIQLMTLEEKVGQMLNLGLASLLTGPFYSYRDTLIFDSVKVNDLLVKHGAGSVQNLGSFPMTPDQWNQLIGYIQNVVKTQTRLGIPVLYGIDAVHGANYTAGSVMFPHQINLAASFNKEAAEQVGALTAYELRASHIPWNYAPVLDVARHPMWGRIFESFGEDTYVATELGTAYVRGQQGTNPAAPDKVLSCAKHFIGYGASYNGKDRSPVMMPANYLRQILLPPFQSAINEGLLSVMISSGAMNGMPSHIDHALITGLLKEELGFKGAVITDWSDIDNLHTVHKVAENEREAIKLSILAGVDICMEPYDASFADVLVDLVNKGEVPMSRINDAVRRILFLKFKAGLFNNPEIYNQPYPEFASAKTDRINYTMACQSLTLLKNENGILPLSADKKILVTGVSANSINYLNGGWSRTWGGQDTSYNDKGKLTILQALQQKMGKQKVVYAPGSGYVDGNYIAEAVAKARQCDVIIACVGEKPSTEKPSDIDELDLPEIQQELVSQLAATGKPVILVMVQGRPRIIREIEPKVKAVLMAYLPGNEGGKAIASTLLGEENPSGKLPYTYPRYSGALWTYDHQLSDERDVNFGLNGFTPQYEFGFGLSYTTFNYSPLKLSADSISMNGEITIETELTNTGNRAGTEVVLLFISDEVASLSPAVKQLKRFERVTLQPGEKQTVRYTLTAKDLAFVGAQNKWITEPGFFTVSVANQKNRFKLLQ